jgi:hypothetical protein
LGSYISLFVTALLMVTILVFYRNIIPCKDKLSIIHRLNEPIYNLIVVGTLIVRLVMRGSKSDTATQGVFELLLLLINLLFLNLNTVWWERR